MILIYHYHITKNHTADSELPVLPKNHEQTKKTTKHLCYVFVPYTPKHSYPSTLEKKKKATTTDITNCKDSWKAQ